MADWLQNLPVVWMALVVFTLTYLVTWGIFAVVVSVATGERARSFKGVSPGMPPPLPKRKCQFDGCALANLALDCRRSAVEFDDRFYESQA